MTYPEDPVNPDAPIPEDDVPPSGDQEDTDDPILTLDGENSEEGGDLADVGEHYREMTRLGAHVRGEGEIDQPIR